MADWEHQHLTVEAAEQYAAWRDKVNKEEEPMPEEEFRDRFPEEYRIWRAAGGKSDIGFLLWLAATRGYAPTPAEWVLIENAMKGNQAALIQLAQRPKV